MRRSRWISLVALFTSLAVVLGGLTVPAPFAGFLLYGVWEIPVVLALLILGPKGGVTVAALNGLALEFINPGGLPTGPLYNFIAEVSMFGGVLAVERVGARRRWGRLAVVAGATALGGLARTAVLTAVNWFALPQPFPVGFSVPESAVPGLLVLIGAFNLTVSLYVIPAAFSIRGAVSSRSGRRGAGGQPFTT